MPPDRNQAWFPSCTESNIVFATKHYLLSSLFCVSVNLNVIIFIFKDPGTNVIGSWLQWDLRNFLMRMLVRRAQQKQLLGCRKRNKSSPTLDNKNWILCCKRPCIRACAKDWTVYPLKVFQLLEALLCFPFHLEFVSPAVFLILTRRCWNDPRINCIWNLNFRNCI